MRLAPRSKLRAVAVGLEPDRVAARSTAATAPARSRPAGCRRARASRAGSRARCSGGRRRAGRGARPGRRAAPWRAPRPAKCSPGRGRPSERRARSGARSDVELDARAGRGAAASSTRAPAPADRSHGERRRGSSRARPRARDARRALELLARDHALGELDEVVVAPCRRPPTARGRRAGAPVASDRRGERPQRQLERESAAREPSAVRRGATARRSFAAPRRFRERRSQAGHRSFSDRSQKCAVCRRISLEQERRVEHDDRHSRVDLHCHSTASQLSQARRPAGARPAGVRDAARGGLRAGQAPRHGLRDDHRSRHDRRRAADRRPARRVRLRGADGPVPRRAAGRARALLRASPPTTTSGCRRTPATSRLCAEYLHEQRDRLRAGAPVLRRRGAADAAPPPAAGAAVRRLGGAQRLARARAEPARRRSTSRRTAAPASAAPTTTPGVDIGRTWTETPRGARRREEFLAHMRAGRVERARRPGQRRQVGARGDGARGRARSARGDGDRRRPIPRAVLHDGRARACARATRATARSAAAASVAGRRARPAARLAATSVELRPRRALS